MTLGTASDVTCVRIYLVLIYSCFLSLCHASPQQTDDPKTDVVVLSDRSQILFKESRHPQNMPLICYYVSDANFFASLSWVTTSTKEIQVKLLRLSSPPRLFFKGPYMWHMEVLSLGSDRSSSCQPTPQPQPREIQATSATYTTAHGNARPLAH